MKALRVAVAVEIAISMLGSLESQSVMKDGGVFTREGVNALKIAGACQRASRRGFPRAAESHAGYSIRNASSVPFRA
jgi:coproporphyrinogen III oxidase